MMDESAVENVMAAQHLGCGYDDTDLLTRPWRWRAGEHRVARRAGDVLHDFGFNGDRRRPVGELSFAAARSVELAAVLVEDPTLVLLDEPTTGLDVGDVEVLTGVLRDLRAQGKAVVVIAHDVGFVMGCCDVVYVLSEGRVLRAGDPTQVQRDPAVIDVYLGAAL
jgi:ABC-type branched-subunit amino acid transport system ATPase component